MALKWDFLQNIPTKIGNVTNKVGSALGTALIGKQELPIEYVNIKDVDTTSPEYAENMPVAEIGVTEAPRVGGLLNDIRTGARENFATGFAAPNWEQTITPDGRKKGLGYRFGEGLGSMARFAESPLGRSLLMAGVVGLTGGGALPALTYGATTGMLNQQNRMKDKMYRNELEKMGFDITGITGYVGDDTFNKIYQSKQLQDNAEYRNALLAGQRKDQEMAIQQRQAELRQKTLSDAADRALKNRELDIKEYQALNEGKCTQNKGDMVFSQLQLLEDAFNNMPQSKAAVGSKAKAILTGATNLVGLRNDDVTAYEAIRNPLVTTLARTIAGEKGVLTDKDFARAEKMVPTSFDSAEQAQAKFKEIRKLVGVSLGGSTPQAGNTTKSGVKYEVID
jgi:hypothetical protein